MHLSVRQHISETAGPIFTKFCMQLYVVMGWSSSGGIAIRYVLPVLWMTSRLAVVGRMSVHGLSVAKYSARIRFGSWTTSGVARPGRV